MSDESWSEERGDRALSRAQSAARKQSAESERAGALIRDFAAAAAQAGITPERLTARAYTGGARYKTQVAGWYLKRDRSVAVGTDGLFYVLNVPPSFLSRFTGTTVSPADAPLELGKGARDGESLPLSQALANRLGAGNDWTAA